MHAAIERWVGWWHRFARTTVWAPGRFPPEGKDYRYRNIFRVVLPLTDIFFGWFGAVGYALTVTSVEREAGPEWQAAWSATMAVSAVLCLIGASFPRLWAVELVAKVPLVGTVLFYILFQLNRITDPEVSAFAGLIVVLILLVSWRIVDLSGTELRPWLRERFVKHDRVVRDAE